MHRAIVAAIRRIQVYQELDIQASHLSLQDVGDGLPLVLLMLPLPPRDVGTPGGRRTKHVTPIDAPLNLTSDPSVTPDVPQRQNLRDGGSVDGGHGGGDGSVQGVVENRRADVGHDGVQQRLTQVLLLGGHGGGRRCWLKRQGRPITASTCSQDTILTKQLLTLQRARWQSEAQAPTTAMSFFSFSKAISHFCSVLRGHLGVREHRPDQDRYRGPRRTVENCSVDGGCGCVTWYLDQSGCSADSSSYSGPSFCLFTI